MPDINPTLALREVVFFNDESFYVVGFNLKPSPTGNQVKYQISQDLPNSFGVGRGIFPSILVDFHREQLQNVAEHNATVMASLETQANYYERTLTGLPIITLNGEQNYSYVWDGTNSYVWDGESYPPYENPIPAGTIWQDFIALDPVATYTDQEDGGGADPLPPVQSSGNITWNDLTLIYENDNPNFILTSTITRKNPDDTIDNVAVVNLSIIGEYTIIFSLVDHQGIYSYNVQRIVTVNDVPVPPASSC